MITKLWYSKIVTATVACGVAVVLAGCASVEEQIRDAVVGCRGGNDSGLTETRLRIFVANATADDVECMLKRLGAPEATVKKVLPLYTGYTEWGDFRVDVSPGPGGVGREMVLSRAGSR
jgi:hypothetical protein